MSYINWKYTITTVNNKEYSYSEPHEELEYVLENIMSNKYIRVNTKDIYKDEVVINTKHIVSIEY